MAMLMRETFYGRHEPVWMGPLREPAPYFGGAPYVGFREPHQFPVLDESFFSPYAGEPLSRLPRTSSAMPGFGHYSDAAFHEPLPRPGPLRSSSAIPAYAYPELPYHDLPSHGPLSHGPTRSSSSIPAYTNLREPRESRPKQHKVAPEIELRVPMSSSKDESAVKETLRKVPGVNEVITDRRTSKVTVSGKVDPQVALKQVQKSKKKADFWTKQIYSQAFIDFIQSKTGRAEPEQEVTSSYHQHGPLDGGDSHHHSYDESENLSSYEEYPGYSERDGGHDSHDEIERGPSHTPFEEEDFIERRRGYYNQHNYGQRSGISPYGMSSSYGHLEESYGTVDDRLHGAPYYEHVEPSFGVRERVPYYERERSAMYGEYGSSYRPSQSYGPSGISNPGYMKRVVSDY